MADVVDDYVLEMPSNVQSDRTDPGSTGSRQSSATRGISEGIPSSHSTLNTQTLLLVVTAAFYQRHKMCLSCDKKTVSI